MSNDVKLIYVRATCVECPHCGEYNDGWLGDPRGKETECDHCGKPFTIAPDAEMRHQ